MLNAYAINPKSGCKGIYQLKDGTAYQILKRNNCNLQYNPFNWQHSTIAALLYLKYLDRIFRKDTVLASNLHTFGVRDPSMRRYFMVAAFNAGEGVVAKAQKQAYLHNTDPASIDNVKPYLSQETRHYLVKVFRIIRHYAKLHTSSPIL